MGSVLLIEEDKYCNYSRFLSKYFLAEGVQRKHGIFLSALDEDSKLLLRGVPCPVEAATKAAAEKRPVDECEDMRIAFMYNQLPKVNCEIPGSSTASTFYDLSTSITESDLSALDVTCYEDTSTGLIGALRQVANKDVYSKSDRTGQDKNLLRVCINSLGSPLWYSDSGFGRSLLMTLLELKAIVRTTNSVCLVTVPGHLLNTLDPQLMGQVRNLVDISIEIESFAASDKETNPVFKDYHGLLHIRKLTAVDTLAAFCPDTLDLAFKLKRKRFVIEKLHLPPELGEAADGGTKVSPTMGCASGGGGSSGSHLLDF